MTSTDAEVNRAFQEWCAMVGVDPRSASAPGGFRLAVGADGKVHIDQAGEGGEVRALCPPMSPDAFCAAVRFVHESMKIKTVQVARAVAKKRRR